MSRALEAATAAGLVLAALAAPPAWAQAAWAQALPEQTPFVGPNDGYPDPRLNLAAFFTEFRCDGQPDRTDLNACVASPRMSSTVVDWRRTDWGDGTGSWWYQIGESYLADNGQEIIQSFSFAPWGAFNAANGDGGQTIFTDGRIARITGTQDASAAAFQNFVGAACGGTGWVIADLSVGISGDLPEAKIGGGQWTGEAGALNSSPDGAACPPMNASYDAWTVDDVSYPFIVFGQPEQRTIPTLISEHFDGAPEYAEREFNASEYGLLRWEAWEGPGGTRPISNSLAERCPVLGGFEGAGYNPPLPGWHIYDCRTWTNIIRSLNWSGDDFGWWP